MTRKAVEDRATIGLCGRAAERTLIGTVSVGSGNSDDSDLAVATGLIASLHTSSGLGGTIAYLVPQLEALTIMRADRGLRARVEKDLRKIQDRADDLVGRHRDAIVAVAEALRERRHLSGDAIRAIFAATARDAAAARDCRRA
jgi:ATP-dependent Zn protease